MDARPREDRQGTSRSTYLWNTVSSMLMAFQSVIMLVVVTHVCDVSTAGVLTLAYAHANLFLNLGKYGVRNYQVSDVERRHSFIAYAKLRVLTSTLMLVFGSAFLLSPFGDTGYSASKSATIFVMLLFKCIDALEDAVHGNYQQNGRLDVGAKVLCFRLSTTIAIFAPLVCLTRDLLLSLSIATAYTALYFLAETAWVWRRYGLPSFDAGGSSKVLPLLKACFPLFLSLFLLFYIGNIPKYTIDTLMDDAAQAIYGFIAMPVFVVGLLSNFIFNPIVASLALQWSKGKVDAFSKRFLRQSIVILLITVGCIVGAWTIGAPVLGALYNTNLYPYRIDLIVLLMGGGLLALATLFTTGITIMRNQRMLTFGYLLVSLIARILCPVMVRADGIDGASWSYLWVMLCLTLWCLGGFLMGLRSNKGSASD